jgi:hypothetical protein
MTAQAGVGKVLVMAASVLDTPAGAERWADRRAIYGEEFIEEMERFAGKAPAA